MNLSVSLRSEVQLGVPCLCFGGHPHRAHVKQLTRPQHRHRRDHGEPPSSQSAPTRLPRGESGLAAPGGKRMASAPPAVQTGHCQSCHSSWIHSQAALGGGSRRRDSRPRSAEAHPDPHTARLSGDGRAGSWGLGSRAAPPRLHCSALIPTPGAPFKALGTLKMSHRGEDLPPRPAVHLRAGAGLC